jgi:hypothetical protein
MPSAGVYDEPLADMESRGVAGLVERREALVLDRESEKYVRIEELRFSGAAVLTAGDNGGELGPRMLFSRRIAASQRVHGSLWQGAMWPQPLC